MGKNFKDFQGGVAILENKQRSILALYKTKDAVSGYELFYNVQGCHATSS